MLVLLGYPLGIYMARVYNNDDFAQRGRFRWLGAFERGFFRVLRVDGDREQDWKSYAKVTLIFSAIFSRLPLRDAPAPGAPVPEPGPPAGRCRRTSR